MNAKIVGLQALDIQDRDASPYHKKNDALVCLEIKIDEYLATPAVRVSEGMAAAIADRLKAEKLEAIARLENQISGLKAGIERLTPFIKI